MKKFFVCKDIKFKLIEYASMLLLYILSKFG